MTKIAVHALGIKGSGKVTVTTLDPAVGYMLWANQDTLAMTTAEYLAFRDKSKRKRVSPYPHSTKDSAAESAPPQQLAQNMPSVKDKPKPATEDTPKEQPVVTTVEKAPVATTKTEDAKPKEKPPSGPLYDIELCTVGSQHAAWLERKRLPEELQSKILLESNKQNKEVRIILELIESRSHAVRIQAELIDLFPESCLIPHEK